MEALVDQRTDHPLAFDLHASDAVPLMTSMHLGVVCGCFDSIGIVSYYSFGNVVLEL